MWMCLWIVSWYIFNLPHVACENTLFQRKPGQYLRNYMIRSLKQESEISCSMSCLNEPDCVSVNFKVKGKGKGSCELNSKILKEIPEETQNDVEYIYLEIFERVRFLIKFILDLNSFEGNSVMEISFFKQIVTI